MIPGAVSKQQFEDELLPLLLTGSSTLPETIVFYCTIGVRSGLYLKQLSRLHPELFQSQQEQHEEARQQQQQQPSLEQQQQHREDECSPSTPRRFMNLRGSILQWYNSGMPLVEPSTNMLTDRIHVYGSEWAIVPQERLDHCIYFTALERMWYQAKAAILS